MQHTSDGGYILGATSRSDISGDKTENSMGVLDYWILKTDTLGDLQWQNTIGGSDNDILNCIRQTSDGGYILGGSSFSSISGDKTEAVMGMEDMWIVKTDNLGNIQWQNTIGGTNNDELWSIQQTADGGYIAGGWSLSGIGADKTEICLGGSDYWMVKLDSAGNIQWQNTIGGSATDILKSIIQTNDGGYMLAGYSNSPLSGDKTENNMGDYDYWIVKTDSAGNIQWQNTIGGMLGDYMYCVKQTTDNGYILGGKSFSDISSDKNEMSQGGSDYWIVKTDAQGIIQWQNTIGANSDDLLYYLQQTFDGGYILIGYSDSFISGDKNEDTQGGEDYWVVKTDTAGTITWQNTIGGDNNDIAFYVEQTVDTGYILGGYSFSNMSGDKKEDNYGFHDLWIIKLAPDTVTSILDIQHSMFNIQISPNPAMDNITLQLPNYLNSSITISILSTIGQSIYTSTVSNGTKEVIIPISQYPAGMYVARVVSGDKVYASRFVIE
jgi:hypothetical protein